MSEEYKKELKIINSYGAVLQKFSGQLVINEKHLSHKKKDIQQAIKLVLAKTLLANGNYDVLISGYMQLGQFQKYPNLSSKDILDPDPKKYLKKRAKHKKMMDKANKEQDKLYGEITLLAKVIKEKVKQHQE